MADMSRRVDLVRNSIIALLLVVLGGVVGYRYGREGKWPILGNSATTAANFRLLSKLSSSQQPSDFKDVDFQTFWEVWRLLQQDYLAPEKLVPEKMVNGAIAGMTSALGDPYTVYLPPDDNKRSGEDLAGAFFGVGIELGYIENTLAVVAPLKGMPADQAGVKAKDLILHVKDTAKNLDQDTSGWTLDQAINHIRGAKGSQVILTLLRKDEKPEPFTVTLTRAEIVVPTVELTFETVANKKVAHLKLSRFGERTNGEWDKAVNEILAERKNIAGIVLDMRNNPGGFFDDSIQIASEFIKQGVVVSQAGRYSNEEFRASGKARLAELPIEVVVNRGSASASEIVAGALRDLRGAKLIGEKTFGKGTVQDRKPLSNGGGIHVTIARWLLPKGSSIHETGLPVDIEVKDNPDTKEDEVLQKAIEVL